MLINNIDTEDISFVVQGAIDPINTKLCLKSIRKNFPGSIIILSTWENSNLNGLDYDMLILSEDPGTCICDFHNIPNNINRQIVSSKAGLQYVKSKYAAKVRSDLIFNGADFINYFNKFNTYTPNYKFVKSRMIALTLYSRLFYINYDVHSVLSSPFHVSDWFIFGYTEDVYQYFNIDIIDDLSSFSSYYLDKKELYTKLPYPHLMLKLTPEQYFATTFFKKNDKYNTILNVAKFDFSEAMKILTNNFVFLNYDYSKIYSGKWQDRSKNEWTMHPFEVSSLIFYADFLKYYKKFCDLNYKIPNNIHKIVNKRKLKCLWHILWFDNFKNFISRIKLKVKNAFKRIFRKILPSYRVSCNIRDILDSHIRNYNNQNNELYSQINQLKQSMVTKRNIRKFKMQIEHFSNNDVKQLQQQLVGIKASLESLNYEIKDIKEAVPFCSVIPEQNFIKKEMINNTEQDYLSMQKSIYEDKSIPSEFIVGQYQWHEQFPYETFLLYKYGDVRSPIFEDFKNKRALDFACGPGRMVKRMQKIFAEVDGCDISKRLIDEAKQNVPDSKFYVTNGNDLGDTPNNHYDFVYCTISMQHIASHTIRMQIIKQIHDALKEGGCITLQMAYNADFPYVQEVARNTINSNQVTVRTVLDQASYLDDDYDAATTNGGHDVGIGKKDLPALRRDFETLFNDVNFWFATVDNYYENFKGEHHVPYWATDWIFIYGVKK